MSFPEYWLKFTGHHRENRPWLAAATSANTAWSKPQEPDAVFDATSSGSHFDSMAGCGLGRPHQRSPSDSSDGMIPRWAPNAPQDLHACGAFCAPEGGIGLTGAPLAG